MTIVDVSGQPWSRKHDEPGNPVVPSAPSTQTPQTLQDLIGLCNNQSRVGRIHAAGSHWALSKAAISDAIFLETRDVLPRQQMNRTLYDVIPEALHPGLLEEMKARRVPPFGTGDGKTLSGERLMYPVHIETGKRVFQLYSELDHVDDDDRSLAVALAKAGNSTYQEAAWGAATLGNSGGQTVFGALTTGTHGGDFLLPPIADGVLAIHLVTDGGKNFWIEPEGNISGFNNPLTEETGVRAALDDGTGLFDFIRNDDLFNSVLVSAGRFGVVYSIVVGAVPQYSLHESRKLTTWNAVKHDIARPLDGELGLYTREGAAPGEFRQNRGLQIVINVSPHGNHEENRVGVTRRWLSHPKNATTAGRGERRGAREQNLEAFRDKRAPEFQNAGNSVPYEDEDADGSAQDGGFLERACSEASFLIGVVTAIRDELENFVESNGKVIGPTMLAVSAAGGGATVTALIATFATILVVLTVVIGALRLAGDDTRLGEVMDDMRTRLLETSDPAKRAAGIFIWQMFVLKGFEEQQKPREYDAISYAMLDGHDYTDRSCAVNIESVEIFFDATHPDLLSFIDMVLDFEVTQQRKHGKAFVGYISLRFTGPTRATIGPQRFERSCAIEIAGMRDVDGTTELIDFAVEEALKPHFNCILHWGQRNDAQRINIEDRLGDDTEDGPSGPLGIWREQLSFITDNGRLDGFSSAFTREKGLEIVRPKIRSLTATGSQVGNPIVISWDASNNPSNTPGRTVALELRITKPNGSQSIVGVSITGANFQFNDTSDPGDYVVELIVRLTADGVQREVSQPIEVTVSQIVVP